MFDPNDQYRDDKFPLFDSKLFNIEQFTFVVIAFACWLGGFIGGVSSQMGIYFAKALFNFFLGK